MSRQRSSRDDGSVPRSAIRPAQVPHVVTVETETLALLNNVRAIEPLRLNGGLRGTAEPWVAGGRSCRTSLECAGRGRRAGELDLRTDDQTEIRGEHDTQQSGAGEETVFRSTPSVQHVKCISKIVRCTTIVRTATSLVRTTTLYLNEFLLWHALCLIFVYVAAGVERPIFDEVALTAVPNKASRSG